MDMSRAAVRTKPLGLPVMALVVVSLALFVGTGCASHQNQPFGPDRLIPPDQSRTVFKPDVSSADRENLMAVARALQCIHPLGCTCFLDGFQTACSLAFACIDAGFCECVSGCENIADI